MFVCISVTLIYSHNSPIIYNADTMPSYHRLYVFGGRGRTRTDADIFLKLYFCLRFFFGHTLIYGPNWNETQGPTVWVPPPRIMILWRSIESTTQIAQLRWRNVANVGMVAVGTTTLAQRRHGRRRHNYGGATSFSQRWANVFLPTICQRCRPCWKQKWKYLLFDFLKGHLFSRCQIQN